MESEVLPPMILSTCAELVMLLIGCAMLNLCNRRVYSRFNCPESQGKEPRVQPTR
jgi:hypothetical protein